MSDSQGACINTAYENKLPPMDTQVNHRAYKRGQTQQGQKHTDATRMIALSAYAETLSVAEASRVSGIPHTTIASWLEHDEVDAQLEVLRNAMRSQLAFKLAQASNLAVDTIIDRLQNGDCKLDKDGNEVRCKVSAKDAGYLASLCIDRHALLTGTSHQGKANSALALVMDKLTQALQTSGLTAGKAAPGKLEQPATLPKVAPSE